MKQAMRSIALVSAALVGLAGGAAHAVVEVQPQIGPWGYTYVGQVCNSQSCCWPYGEGGVRSDQPSFTPFSSEGAAEAYVLSTLPNQCGTRIANAPPWPTSGGSESSYYCGNLGAWVGGNTPYFWPEMRYTDTPAQGIDYYNYVLRTWEVCNFDSQNNPVWSARGEPHLSMSRSVQCPPGYVIKRDASNNPIGPCVSPPCSNDTACNNGVFCDGAEVCDSNGECQPGPARCPDDGRVCTQDSCNEAADVCVYGYERNLCECDPTLLEEINVSIAATQLNLDLTANCPKFGGLIGARAAVESVQAQLTAPSCDNGCRTTASVAAQGEVWGFLCRVGKSVPLSGNLSYDSVGCVECADSTCLEGCGAGACITGGGSISGSPNLSSHLGLKRNHTTFGNTILLNIGGRVSANVEIGATLERVTNSGACTSCNEQLSGGLRFGLGASAGATVHLTVQTRWGDVELVLPDVVSLAVDAQGDHLYDGDSYCARSEFRAKFSGNIPIPAFGSKLWPSWYKPKRSHTLYCSIYGAGCTQTGSCGPCSCNAAGHCNSDRGDFSCSVRQTPPRYD